MNLQIIEYKENTEYEWKIVGKGIMSLKVLIYCSEWYLNVLRTKNLKKIDIWGYFRKKCDKISTSRAYAT